MNLEKLLYDYNPDIEPERGSLLISEPMMEEEIFCRSVVMILDIDRGRGHLGLVMNKPTRLTLRSLMPSWESGGTVPLFCGGPVDNNRLFMLHTLGSMFEGSTEVIPGIYVGGRIESIVDYIEAGGEIEGKIRFFLGYSGWSRNQLEEEKRSHSWAVDLHPDASGLLTGEGNSYWRREVGRLGERYRSWLMVPQDPSYN
ncbi:MAG: YqgE/AlgH family protein [Muribaculaceae bacterium]|nr:YqgE/AlgH family protein [Muribaculaceae bacterium]